jgi:hypothetical protein
MGFAALTAEARREASSRGGRTSAARGHSQRVGFTSATAAAANRMRRRHRFTSAEASELAAEGALGANITTRAGR